MKKLSELFNGQTAKRGAVRSAWDEQIKAVLEFMGEDYAKYRYWCLRLKKFKNNPSNIRDLLKEASSGNNPRALFNWLLKK